MAHVVAAAYGEPMITAAALGVRTGLSGGTEMSDIAAVRRDATWASEVGFDSFWLSHIAGVDPLVALAAAAADAPTIELGTSVVATVGRHPIALAQLARTVQQACAGRFTLGIGPSHQIVAEALYGESWDRPAERTREYLEALVPLCDGQPASVNGNQVTAHMTLNVPCEPVPVVLAALGPRMLELAGRLTAGTHVGQTGPKTIASHTAPLLRAAAADAGRPEPRIIALIGVCVADDPDAVRRAAATGAASYGALPSYRAMLDREGVADPTELLLAGSPSQIADGLAGYVDAGVTDLRLGVMAPDDAHRQTTHDMLAEFVGG